MHVRRPIDARPDTQQTPTGSSPAGVVRGFSEVSLQSLRQPRPGLSQDDGHRQRDDMRLTLAHLRPGRAG